MRVRPRVSKKGGRWVVRWELCDLTVEDKYFDTPEQAWSWVEHECFPRSTEPCS